MTDRGWLTPARTFPSRTFLAEGQNCLILPFVIRDKSFVSHRIENNLHYWKKKIAGVRPHNIMTQFFFFLFFGNNSYASKHPLINRSSTLVLETIQLSSTQNNSGTCYLKISELAIHSVMKSHDSNWFLHLEINASDS